MSRFNEETIEMVHPNQQKFVGAFQNALKARHFNESLAHKLVYSIKEIMATIESYVKGQGSNTYKRARDSKEQSIEKPKSSKYSQEFNHPTHPR